MGLVEPVKRLLKKENMQNTQINKLLDHLAQEADAENHDEQAYCDDDE